VSPDEVSAVEKCLKMRLQIGLSRIELTAVPKVIIITLLFVAMSYGNVSLWLWKNLKNSGIFT